MEACVTLPVSIEIKEVPMDLLMAAMEKETIRGYCEGCGNYGVNYGCPAPNDDPVLTYGRYRYAYLIRSSVETWPLRTKWDLCEKMTLDSRVLHAYTLQHPEIRVDLASKLSMYAFGKVKDRMAEDLLTLEEKILGSVSLPPGTCTLCQPCLKSEGQPCVTPHKLRYSLESLGFDVSLLYKSYFDAALTWTKEELAPSFHSLSALFTPRKVDIKKLYGYLAQEALEFS